MAGNTLGKKVKFIYTSDGGVNYNMSIDENLGEAAGLPIATTQTLASSQRRPSRFKPRCVFVEAFIPETDTEEGGDGYIARKELTCNADSPLYRTVSPGTVEIDGVLFTTTGRRGEKLSF